MICKIVLNTETADLNKICDKLSDIGNIVFLCRTLYFNTHQQFTKKQLKNILKKANAEEHIIYELTRNNSLEEGEMIHSWVNDYFVEEELNALNAKEYEAQRQALQDRLELAKALYNKQLIVVPKKEE